MLLSGQLSDWSVGDLLQMLHITKKTASLHVDGTDRGGAVYFNDGAVISADVTLGAAGAPGSVEHIAESVYVLQLLTEGTFDVRNEVPPVTVDAVAVADALEEAGVHLAAERALEATGLLSARALRLAQEIDGPISLSSQVWRAISVSIPAFTFPELEQRLGRAGAVSTVEQFRDLGILEAVMEEPEPTADFDAAADAVGFVEESDAIEVQTDGPPLIVPDTADQPDLVVVDGGAEQAVEADTAAAGISSLTAAIRAAATAGPEDGEPITSDDESRLLAEAAGPDSDEDEGSIHRTVRSLVGNDQ